MKLSCLFGLHTFVVTTSYCNVEGTGYRACQYCPEIQFYDIVTMRYYSARVAPWIEAKIRKLTASVSKKESSGVK